MCYKIHHWTNVDVPCAYCDVVAASFLKDSSLLIARHARGQYP